MSALSGEDRYLVPGLVRGLEALKVFTPENPSMTLSQIARELGVSRSAAFRTVYTLSETGCLLHDDRSGLYSLGPGVLRLTHGYAASREIVEASQSELEDLHRRTGWSSHLGVRDGTSVLYLLRISGVEQRVSIVQVGTRLPARNTVLGRVLLADLSEEELIQLYRQDGSMPGRGTGPSLPEMLKQRERDAAAGLVTHAGDFEARILSVAAPLRSADGRVVAAISLTAPVSPKAESELQGRARHELEETALKLSRRLGWSPEGDE
ncbi:IclR family transcriptional regulator [Pseudooceanicola sp. 200-1SW]|uniref:IclR family transcriptional regulator n=1 Tax=Pseudooceanicola sp. 200-1SW TaxID=3425949 RepID=UPI003D7F6722